MLVLFLQNPLDINIFLDFLQILIYNDAKILYIAMNRSSNNIYILRELLLGAK